MVHPNYKPILQELLSDYKSGVPLDRLTAHYKLTTHTVINLVHADITKDLGAICIPQSNSKVPTKAQDYS